MHYVNKRKRLYIYLIEYYRLCSFSTDSKGQVPLNELLYCNYKKLKYNIQALILDLI